MARPRLSESSQKPPSAVSDSAMRRIALTPTRPARRRSRIASLKMNPSTGSALVLHEPPVLETQRAALEQRDQAGLMGGEEHGGAAAPDVLDQAQDLARHVLVEVAG